MRPTNPLKTRIDSETVVYKGFAILLCSDVARGTWGRYRVREGIGEWTGFETLGQAEAHINALTAASSGESLIHNQARRVAIYSEDN